MSLPGILCDRPSPRHPADGGSKLGPRTVRHARRSRLGRRIQGPQFGPGTSASDAGARSVGRRREVPGRGRPRRSRRSRAPTSSPSATAARRRCRRRDSRSARSSIGMTSPCVQNTAPCAVCLRTSASASSSVAPSASASTGSIATPRCARQRHDGFHAAHVRARQQPVELRVARAPRASPRACR